MENRLDLQEKTGVRKSCDTVPSIFRGNVADKDGGGKNATQVGEIVRNHQDFTM